MLQLVHHLANLNIQGDPRIAMEPEHDPLVAALPPATDYITYLTILEYTLKPSNIATLNRLLLQDDGTLAREIGWNLIDILVSLAPWMKAAGEGEEALRSCLNVIARRGNPRETVITVSATLEAWTGDARRFGGGADGEGDEEDEEIPGDEHPAFRGEADPIHLGSIRLDGMPDVNRRSGEGSATSPEAINSVPPPRKRSEADFSLQFDLLLTTLGTVLPRIKTKYPSRFYAMALPAALKAYRESPNKIAGVSTFLGFLEKLSGKEKPALPPRTPSVSGPTTSSVSTVSSLISAPDPEAQDESGAQPASQEEQAILQRLLQAVLVELLDDFAASMEDSEIETFAWTTRLKERREPGRVVPGKMSEIERWQSEETCLRLDRIIERFLALATHLKLSTEVVFRTDVINKTAEKEAYDQEEDDNAAADPPSDYPQKPSDIPFSRTGLSILYAATVFRLGTLNTIHGSIFIPPSFVEYNLMFMRFEILQAQGHDIRLSLATIDALLTLQFMAVTSPDVKLTGFYHNMVFPQCLTVLLNTSAVCRNSQLRDAAHETAKIFFHSYPKSNMKITNTKTNALKVLLQHFGDKEPTVAAAVVVWLKDEIAASTGDAVHQHAPSSSDDSNVRDLTLVDVTADAALISLLFPAVPKMPGEAQAKVPFFVASLNLFCLIRQRYPENQIREAEEMVGDLLHVKPHLLRGDAGHDGVETTVEPNVDYWALEDALNRIQAPGSRRLGP